LILNEPLAGAHWFLPRGKVQLHEATTEALLRELSEELGMDLQIGKLAWIIERFFLVSESSQP
jgi:8-oxo-dGTP pyrophosphatase MutT (NUDIX family)